MRKTDVCLGKDIIQGKCDGVQKRGKCINAHINVYKVSRDRVHVIELKMIL